MKDILLKKLAELIGSDDQEMLNEIFDCYRQSLTEHIAKLSIAVPAGDFAAIRSSAHALKGCADNIGHTMLREIVFDMENAAKAGDRLRSQELFIKLQKEGDLGD